jgi:hypothetical protein
LPNLPQLFAQGMLFSSQRQKFLMPELHLLVLWQVRHVVNYGYFLLGDFIHLPHKIDYCPAVAPRLGLMSQVHVAKMNRAAVLIPLFRNSVKIRAPLELLVVVISERPDSCIDLDVLRHGLEVAVLHLCDLRTDEPHFGLTLCDLRIQDSVIVTLDARRNGIHHQPNLSEAARWSPRPKGPVRCRNCSNARLLAGPACPAGGPSTHRHPRNAPDAGYAQAVVRPRCREHTRPPVSRARFFIRLKTAIRFTTALDIVPRRTLRVTRRATFAVNVEGTLNVTRAALPSMRARKSGHILNLSSVGGFVSWPGWGIYCATKFMVEGEAMQAELKPLGIKLAIVEPGPFRTDFLDASSLERTKDQTLVQVRLYGNKILKIEHRNYVVNANQNTNARSIVRETSITPTN